MDDTLKLITESYTKDKYGVQRQVQTEREVLCKVNSVTQSEFFACKQAGLNPEYVFDVALVEYNGEKVVEYRGNLYAVYRTYLQVGEDYIELYTERQRGVRKG